MCLFVVVVFVYQNHNYHCECHVRSLMYSIQKRTSAAFIWRWQQAPISRPIPPNRSLSHVCTMRVLNIFMNKKQKKKQYTKNKSKNLEKKNERKAHNPHMWMWMQWKHFVLRLNWEWKVECERHGPWVRWQGDRKKRCNYFLFKLDDETRIFTAFQNCKQDFLFSFCLMAYAISHVWQSWLIEAFLGRQRGTLARSIKHGGDPIFKASILVSFTFDWIAGY